MGREKQKQFLRYFNHLLEQAIHLRMRNINVVGEEKNHGDIRKEENIKVVGEDKNHGDIRKEENINVVGEDTNHGDTNQGDTNHGDTNHGVSNHPIGAPNEIDFALRLNKIADVSQQQAIIEELDKAAYYIERNANGKMLFQALTIKLYHIIADKSLFLTN